jgi:hypothetical protein
MQKLMLLTALLCSSCSAQEAIVAKDGDRDPHRLLRCYEHGSASGKFCRASMLQVVTSRGLFDGRQVIIPGFVGDVQGDLYLFPSREFYLSRDLSSSVRLLGNLETLKGAEQTNAIVFGTFSLDAPDPSTLMKPVGAITVLSVRDGYNKP